MPGLRDKKCKRRSLLRLLCLWLVTFGAGCELPQEPGDLFWDVNVNVPFGVRTYGIWELADPDTTLRRVGSGVGMEDDSSVYFSAWADLSAEIGDSLYVKEIDVSIERYVTAIEAPLDYDTLLQYSLGQLNPGIASLHGTVQNLPQHDLSSALTLSMPEGYDSLEVDTGSVRLVIANRLPYPVQNVEIRAAGNLLARVASISADQQAVIDTSLAGTILTSSFAFSISAMGAGGASILVDSTDELSVTVTVDTVTASRFYGITPEQTVERDSSLSIDQQHHIDLVVIESGSMTLTIGNLTQFADTITLKIPNFVSRLNDTLAVTQFLTPGDSHTVVVPLAQYRLRPDGDNDQTIKGILKSHTPRSAESRAFVGDGEVVYGRVIFERSQIEYFSGTLNNLELSLDSLSIDIERPPQGWDVIRPLEVEARIHVDRGIGGVLDADIDAETWLFGTRVGESAIEVNDLPLDDSSLVTIPDLADLLADYPNLLTANGTGVLSGTVSVFNNTVVSLGLELRAALAVVIRDTLSPVGTVEKVKTQDFEDIVSGEVTISLWNHLPIGGRCFLVADYDSMNVVEGSGANLDTLFNIDIPRPTLFGGRAIDVSLTRFTIPLDQTWLDYFASDSFFVRTEIAVENGLGDTLIVHGGDYLSVQALAQITYAVHPGEVE